MSADRLEELLAQHRYNGTYWFGNDVPDQSRCKCGWKGATDGRSDSHGLAAWEAHLAEVLRASAGTIGWPANIRRGSRRELAWDLASKLERWAADRDAPMRHDLGDAAILLRNLAEALSEAQSVSSLGETPAQKGASQEAAWQAARCAFNPDWTLGQRELSAAGWKFDYALQHGDKLALAIQAYCNKISRCDSTTYASE